MTRQRQLPSQICNTEPVSNGQFCRINVLFQPLANLPSCVTALYAKKDWAIKEQCSVVISHMPHTYIPLAVTSNLGIIPWNPQTKGSTMTIICLDKATRTVPLQQPFHILRLSPACSATNYFHLPPHYEDYSIVTNVSPDTANINTFNISTQDFRIWQHLSRNWTQPPCRNWQMFLKYQLHSSTEIWSMPVNQFTHSPSRMTIRTHPSYGQS